MTQTMCFIQRCGCGAASAVAVETALYDLLNPWDPGDRFYHELVMAADSLLDVGCGTGIQ